MRLAFALLGLLIFTQEVACAVALPAIRCVRAIARAQRRE